MAPILILTRYVPPSVYVDGAKISAKVIVLIVILVTTTLILSTLICYICIKRRQSKNRRLRQEKEERENKQLKARINGRNAKFYAPGLVLGSRSGHGEISKDGAGDSRGKVWTAGLKVKVDKGVLDRWNMREREYNDGSEGGLLVKKGDFELNEIEMQQFGIVRTPQRAWLKWGRK